ncbi:DNA ligase 1-like [Physella acuta]|uniref:DNA ligase 1-like n=1 Tax=Physella acuta TaxID=109671 RepID=UPI0027DDBC43|nr:DNA ligase 1-like [Physella acuta]
MKLLFVLLVVPMVLAGDFAKMWSEMEEKLKSKGWGEEDRKDLGHKFGQGNDQDKKWGDKEVKGWGEQDEKKGWGEKDDEKKGWGEKDDEKKGWGEKDDEKKGWGEKDDEKKGWGEKDDEKKGWGDKKSKGWGDDDRKGRKNDDDEHRRRRHDDDDDDEHRRRRDDDDHKSAFEQFKSWISGGDREDNGEFKDYMQRNVFKFKEYVRAKEMREKQERDAKMAIYKQMEKVHMKKMLTEKLSSLSHEYMYQKLSFMYAITGHFLEFCKCDSSKDILQRVHDGTYGSVDMIDDGNQYPTVDYYSVDGNFSSLANSSIAAYLSDPSKKQERIKWFADLELQEQFKFVLNEYINVMCSGAKQFTSMLVRAEPELAQYRRNHQF